MVFTQDIHHNIHQPLHHAYGIEGEIQAIRAGLMELFSRDMGIAIVGNPDFFHEKFETLTIDDARRIKNVHAEKAFSQDKPRIFLIELYGITREAQNALLKVVEEPMPGNHFFFVLPTIDMFLPTLRSRLQIISHVGDREGGDNKKSRENEKNEIKNFVQSDLKEKIAFVDTMAASISDGKMAKHEAIDFLNLLERYIYTHPYSHSDFVKNKNVAVIDVFEALARARMYMNDRAPSVKMLLEYVALNV